MISAHSSADVFSRCTHSRKVSASSTAKTKANVAHAASKAEQTETTTKVSETGEELAGICVSNSWVKLVTTTGLLLNIFYTREPYCASFTVPLRQPSHAPKILIFGEIF